MIFPLVVEPGEPGVVLPDLPTLCELLFSYVIVIREYFEKSSLSMMILIRLGSTR